MPSYAPLPQVFLDPRNEAELVQQAARRVYESSNATLNDFSSGSPIMALLEGQAHAQAEFLKFANDFPESVLVEWIGPFLGAQRRTGSGAVAQITFTIEPRDEQFDVYPGYILSTTPAITGGDSISFVTTELLTIAPGQTTGDVRAVSIFKSAAANVPAGTINRSETSLAGVLSVTNAEAAAGGQDAELLSEVKERFFSLIRRRNPVSAEDWEDWFTDAIGPGTGVTVLPRRSERDTYIYGGPYSNILSPEGTPFAVEYGGNYISSNPSVSFYVLNPNGTPITTAQRNALQTMMKWSLPTEFLGYVYPMEVGDVDFVLDLKYDPTKPYAQNMGLFSKTVRENLFTIMTPNQVFPIDYDQQVTDVESALVTSFPVTLGTTNQYVDPDVEGIRAYSSPVLIGAPRFTAATPTPFVTGYRVHKNDLILVDNSAGQIFYPAYVDFNPSINTKYYHVNIDDLDVELIRALEVGRYKAGDVVWHEDELYVVLSDFTWDEQFYGFEDLKARGYFSEPKSFGEWSPRKVLAFDPETKGYDPEIFAYEDGDLFYDPAIPRTPIDIPANKRPGSPVFVANRDFEIAPASTDLGTVQLNGSVGTHPVEVKLLVEGRTYEQDDYVKTPIVNEVYPNAPSRYNCYLDPVNGVVAMYAKVAKGFTFEVESRGTYKQAFDLAVEDGILEVVEVVLFQDCKGNPTFSNRPFRYEARFFAGEYVRYRPKGGFDVDELEKCVREREECDAITEGCRRLFDQNLPLPQYFYVLKDFTPYTQDIQQLVDDEMMIPVAYGVFTENYYANIPNSVEINTPRINTYLIDSYQIESLAELSIGDTCVVRDIRQDEPRGVYVWHGGENGWIYESPYIAPYRELFRFAPGDVASFRYVSEVRTYEATEHVTPVLDLEVYYDNGVFVRSYSSETVKWLDPNYHLEDFIYGTKSGAPEFFRSLRSFTPTDTRLSWSGAEVATNPRMEEIYRNLLKFVVRSDCSDAIKTRLRDGTSAIKLGWLQLNLTARSQGSEQRQFVFESTPTLDAAAQLSVFPGSEFPYGPVDYGTGTIAL